MIPEDSTSSEIVPSARQLLSLAPGQDTGLRRSLGFETAQSWASGHLLALQSPHLSVGNRPYLQVLPERSPLHPRPCVLSVKPENLTEAEAHLCCTGPVARTAFCPPCSHRHLSQVNSTLGLSNHSKANTTPQAQTSLLSPKSIDPSAPG